MLLNLLIFIIVVGLLVWLLGFLPIPEPFKQIVMVIAIIIVVIACLQALFGVDLLGHIRTAVR